MKKLASIVAVALFTVGMFATTINEKTPQTSDVKYTAPCDDCSGGGTGRGQ